MELKIIQKICTSDRKHIVHTSMQVLTSYPLTDTPTNAHTIVIAQNLIILIVIIA